MSKECFNLLHNLKCFYFCRLVVLEFEWIGGECQLSLAFSHALTCLLLTTLSALPHTVAELSSSHFKRTSLSFHGKIEQDFSKFSSTATISKFYAAHCCAFKVFAIMRHVAIAWQQQRRNVIGISLYFSSQKLQSFVAKCLH